MVFVAQGTLMKTAANVLKSKGHQSVHTITPEASVFDAVQLMADKDIGALLVMDADEIAGIVTERDYARKVVLQGRSSSDTPVHAIMSAPVVCVGPMDSVADCMAIMTERHIRHLPVLDGGRLAGIVSIGDLVKEVIEEQKQEISYLQQYIAG